MSTETNANPNGAASNAAPAAQSAQAAPAAQPAAKPKFEVDYDPNNPPWLNDRLERERKTAAKEAETNARKALLAELGFDDPEVAKKLAAEEKKRAEERKSLEQRVAERDATLKAKEDRNKELEESVKSYAEGQLAGLTEQQKAAVLAIAGNDPPKQLKAIEALRPTWTSVAPSAPAAPAQAPNGAAPPNAAQQQQPAAPPAKPAAATAPPPNAPPPAGSQATENRLETYEWLQKNRPFEASAYFQVHYTEINEARSKRSN